MSAPPSREPPVAGHHRAAGRVLARAGPGHHDRPECRPDGRVAVMEICPSCRSLGPRWMLPGGAFCSDPWHDPQRPQDAPEPPVPARDPATDAAALRTALLALVTVVERAIGPGEWKSPVREAVREARTVLDATTPEEDLS